MEAEDTLKAFERFRNKLESFTELPAEDFDKLAALMHEKHFDKGEVILKEGQVCREFYFIVSGYIRSFSLENGKELNIKFYFENDIASDFSSYRTEEPSLFYMVAMEDTTVLYATKAESGPLFDADTALHLLLFRFFQDLFLKEEEHSNTFKLLAPAERYNFLVENYPQYINRIPLIYLASYLGISRETLTRIRQNQG